MDSAPGGALDLQFQEEAFLSQDNLQVLMADSGVLLFRLNCFSK